MNSVLYTYTQIDQMRDEILNKKIWLLCFLLLSIFTIHKDSERIVIKMKSR